MKASTIITIIFVLGMILSFYGYGAFTFYIIASIFCIISTKITLKNIHLVYTNTFCCFLLAFIAVRIFRMDFAFPLGIFFYILILGFYCGQLRMQKFLSIYRIVAFANIAVFFIQTLMKVLIGHSFAGLMTFLPIAVNGDFEMDINAFQEKQMYGERSSAFFSEPSHFAQFLLPLLCIELFSSNDKARKKRIGLILLTLILTQSGCALLGLMVIALAYLLRCFTHMKKNKVFVTAFLSSIFIVVASISILHSDYGEKFMERQEEFSGDKMTDSGFIRVVRGYYIYDEMSVLEHWLGISKNKVQEYADKSIFSQSFAMDNGIYLNHIQRLLINDGIICTILYVLFLLNLGKGCNYAGKSIIAVFIALSFIESLYFSASMQLFIVSTLFMKKVGYERELKVIRL